jgi:hypothetical protein
LLAVAKATGEPTAAAKLPPRKKSNRADALDTEVVSSSKKTLAVSGETILELGNLTGYQPFTEQSRAAYELILRLLGLRDLLGYQGPQFLRDAAGYACTRR